MRFAPYPLVFALTVASSAGATEVTGSLAFGQIRDDGTVTREGDAAARFALGGAADLIGRLDFGLSSVGSNDAGYASAGLGTPFGSIDVGLPRSILELGPLPDPARFNASTARGTFRPLAAEVALDQGLTAGVRVLAERGPVQIGTSYHSVDNEDDGIVGVAGRYNVAMGTTDDGVAVYGAVESDGDVERYRLGTEVTMGRAIAALDLLRTGEDGSSASQVSLGLAVTESITLGVTGLREDAGGLTEPDNRFGVGAAMTMETGTFLRGGIDRGSEDDFAVDLEVGFQF